VRDIGGLIWIVIVVIGVISSIVKNAKRAAAQREAARPRMAPAPQPVPVPRAPSPAQRIIESFAMPPVAAEPPPVAAAIKRTPVTVPRAKPVAAPVVAAPVTANAPIRGMFGRGSIVKAIVAAEVLGPPKSQQEYFWSPRHNDPSI
jgi:hypothetical protein